MELATKQDLDAWRKLLLEDISKLLKKEAPKPKERWIKSREVREILQCSPGTLQSLKGKLRHAKINGTVYYEYDAIMEMLKQASTNN